MSEREKILARVRDALRGHAPYPGEHHDSEQLQPSSRPPASGVSSSRHPERSEPGERGGRTPQAWYPPSSAPDVPHGHGAAEFREWLPAVGPDYASQATLFAKNASDLKADFVQLATNLELASRLRELASTDNWRRLATHAGTMTDLAVSQLDPSLISVLYTDGGYKVADMERCDAGITECEALIAQTGSVLISSRASGGRALSVLPPHHVVVARACQMLPDLPAAFELLKEKYAAGYPSFISFVTGPSRTGDIERILVLGAHGPKRLTIFCLP